MALLAESLKRIKPSATIAVTDKARALKAAGGKSQSRMHTQL